MIINVDPIVEKQIPRNTGVNDKSYRNDRIEYMKQYIHFVAEHPDQYYYITGMYDEMMFQALSNTVGIDIVIESDIHDGFYNGMIKYYFRIIIDNIRYHIYIN